MSSHRTALVSDWHEVACRLDPPVMPPNISDNSDVKRLQQGTRRLQTTGGIVVAGNDYGCHSWPGAAQPHNRIVEELLRLSGRVLTFEHVTGDYQCIDIALNDDLFKALEYFAVLMLAGKPRSVWPTCQSAVWRMRIMRRAPESRRSSDARGDPVSLARRRSPRRPP